MSYLKCILIIRVRRIYREINNSFVFKYRKNTFFLALFRYLQVSISHPFSHSTWFFLCQQHTIGVHFSSQSGLQSRFFHRGSFVPRKRMLHLRHCHSRIHTRRRKRNRPSTYTCTSIFSIRDISSARVEIPDRGQPSWNWRFSNRPKLSFARKNHCHASEQMARHSRARVWHGVYHVGWNDQICPNRGLNASIVDEILRYVCISKRFRLCKREVYSVSRSENRFYQRRLTLQPLVWLILSICF